MRILLVEEKHETVRLAFIKKKSSRKNDDGDDEWGWDKVRTSVQGKFIIRSDWTRVMLGL